MPKWTPKTETTWRYNPMPGYQYAIEIDAGMLLVANGEPIGKSAEVRANLTLAAAAPDLYTALEEAIEFIEPFLREYSPAARASMLKSWRAALVKANPARPANG